MGPTAGSAVSVLRQTSAVQLANAAVAVTSDPRQFGLDGDFCTSLRAAVRQLSAAVAHRLREVSGLASSSGHNSRLRGARICPELLNTTSPASVAFKLATAGVADVDEVFEKCANLVHNTIYEHMQKPRGRRRRRTLGTATVMAMLEKLAVACVRRDHPCFEVGARFCSAVEDAHGTPNLKSLKALRMRGSLSLFDNQPLLWLFRHAARQRKRRVDELPKGGPDTIRSKLRVVTQASENRGGARSSHDVVDIGCGFGTSLLGFACDVAEVGAHPLSLIHI